jgi:hypothetical protein
MQVKNLMERMDIKIITALKHGWQVSLFTKEQTNTFWEVVKLLGR